jgi:hypothetical protein
MIVPVAAFTVISAELSVLVSVDDQITTLLASRDPTLSA